MTEWIPFLQALIWPLFVTVLLLGYRKSIARIFGEVHRRVERGDPFEIGANGIRLPPFTPGGPTGPEPRPGVQTVPENDWASRQMTELARKPGLVGEPRIHLVHTAHREPSMDNGEYRYHRIQVHLEGDRDADLDQVVKVVYHLHPTFRRPDREVTDRVTKFALTTAGWGMFELSADVYLRDRSEPIKLKRYLNF